MDFGRAAILVILMAVQCDGFTSFRFALNKKGIGFISADQCEDHGIDVLRNRDKLITQVRIGRPKASAEGNRVEGHQNLNQKLQKD